MSHQELSLSEQEQIRREKRSQLQEMGINPYPPQFEQSHHSIEVLENPDLVRAEESDTSPLVSIAGRIMARRIMGKASFAEIQDDCGRIQLYLNRDEVCKGEDKSLYNEVFKKLIDIGEVKVPGDNQISMHPIVLS